ncbi:MAG: hypothetical protein U5N21_05180 [Rhodococcus sp. (in: high G+C Gram-positive bacteria)]|nr:hypothetical protein [Rhodococcus sp. (in: high G+C Gram-positive bacteria)]
MSSTANASTTNPSQSRGPARCSDAPATSCTEPVRTSLTTISYVLRSVTVRDGPKRRRVPTVQPVQ